MRGSALVPVGLVAAVVYGAGALAAPLGDGPRHTPAEPPAAAGQPLVPRPAVLPDLVVVKLTREAAARATGLPETGLPEGLAELDAFVERQPLAGARRAIRRLGLPHADEGLFRDVGLDRAYLLQLAGDTGPRSTVDLARELDAQPWVEYAEPVWVARPTQTVPNDPDFPLQWAHRNTGQIVNGITGSPDADTDADLAWDTATGSPSAIVAVLDTGIDMTHLDLRQSILPGYDFQNDDADPQDTQGHGTAAAGIAAATGNNNLGVSGICWNCGIIPLRVSSSVNEADAMVFAADNGADAYNMSHTFGAAWIQIIIDATEYATGVGALGFASATNFTGYNIGTPAAYPEVVPVGGSNQSDARAYAYSDVTELTAPGPNTRSTALGGGYTYFGGTSSSSPYAAGLAALLRSHDPGLHVRELRHLMRLGCDDQVGLPSEDTPGWDQFMGYGRVNADRTIGLIDGPWLALDRPHYVCAGELTVALKDETAGASVDVTLTGSDGGDVETVTVTPVAGADGYYEGTIGIAWAGKDGPVVPGDGTLDMAHDETIDAAAGVLSATAFMQCRKKVCNWGAASVASTGDCDGDGAMDPGELWSIAPPVISFQTEEMFGVRVRIETTHPDVTVLKDEATYGDLPPFVAGVAGVADSARVQVAPGAAADTRAEFTLVVSGEGWEGDQFRCQAEEGFGNTFSFSVNRDLGIPVTGWDFDDGTAQGFLVGFAHGSGGTPSGDLSECNGASWGSDWNGSPANDRAHSGAFAMRLGDGSGYAAANDAGLVSAPFTVPAGGGAISFYTWMDSYLNDDFRAWDGMVVEARRTGDVQWTYLDDATYTFRQIRTGCAPTHVPFGLAERVPLIAGDGAGSTAGGDQFDVQHQADLSGFAGEEVTVRWRFGSHDFADAGTHGQGAWIDTVAAHDAWVADAWPGTAPGGLAGSDAACGASFDLSWNPVPGAGGYEIHRSETSCADALQSLGAHATTTMTAYSDTSVVADVPYYYAVGATAAGSGCPTARTCITGGCVACTPPPDPTGLTLRREGGDVALSWTGSADVGPAWNVYRDAAPDPAGWGAPLAAGVVDAEPGTPGVQHTDTGAVGAGPLHHYLVTEVTCAESPL